MKGFSPRNLKQMRSFAEAWPDEQIVQQLAAQLPWFHSCVLLDRVKVREHRLGIERDTWKRAIRKALDENKLRKEGEKRTTHYWAVY